MSGFIEGDNCNQATLFPERLDDYVAEDSPVKTEPNDTGRPGYHPSTMLTKTALFIMLAILPMACQEVTIGVIHNGMTTPITITYALRTRRSFVDASMVCLFDVDSSQRPRLRHGRPIPNLGDPGWTHINKYRSTREPCTAEFELEPGYSAHVFTNGTCSDYEEYLKGAQFESTFEYFRIQSARGRAEFTDWETANLFERSRAGSCIYTYR